jgi:glycine/D-amino acid oxidase-like deaminating enzyme/nitrite reductase/ring-hydroxylating ferredoxin subunit
MAEKPKSLWIGDEPSPLHPALVGGHQADVAIVGGGISGVTAGLLLKRAGKKVLLVESRRVGWGNSGLTTAHLTTEMDTRYHELAKSFGRDGARLAADSQRAALERIASFAREESPDCGFERVPAFLYSEAGGKKDEDDFQAELEAARGLGFECSLVRQTPLPFPAALALRFENQARFHPRKYLLALAARLDGGGSRVFEHSPALEIEDGEPARVKLERGYIEAKDVIVASHVPVSDRVLVQTKLAAYRSYVLALRLRRAFPPGLFWDTADPYHYFRGAPMPDGEYLIVGGEDHRTGQEEDTEGAYRRLLEWSRAHLEDFEPAARWSGQIIETVDGLPYIGRDALSRHVYTAAGYSGTGMTHGTLAAMILSDLILGRPNAWAELYDATRVKPLASAKAYVSENISFPAHLVGDRLAESGSKEGAENPAPGEGSVFKRHGQWLAASRGQDGALRLHSAVCPHLGCLVKWNRSESSWDCPCHGSRFDEEGRVLDGPAAKGLEPIKLQSIQKPEGA